ncbi:MAG: class I SAM-dependent methyltransferase [Proteobacteria bacterium]|nr:class I SAM-dependent methyltransferase [Pseudomonadota bacterium]
MQRNEIFRDTNSLYLGWDEYASSELLEFGSRYSGKMVLDVGCSIGEYSREMSVRGFNCVGVDYNPKYIEKAKAKGVEAYVMDACHLDFKDKSFDSILMFEILEHLGDPLSALQEAGRVAKKSIMLTVPNFSKFHELNNCKLTYGDVLEEDHVNFFTKEELKALLNKISKHNIVMEREPIYMHRLLPWYIRKPISLLYNLKLLKPSLYRRFYAVIWLEESTTK